MNENKQIKYEPLNNKYKFTESYKYLKDHNKIKPHSNISIIFVLLFALAAILIVNLATAFPEHASSIITITIIATLILAIFSIYWYAKEVKNKFKKYNFAQANNGQYFSDIHNPAYDGLFFRWGKNKIINEEYQLKTQKYSINIGNYSFSLSDFNTYKNGYIQIEINSKVPNIILDSKQNNLLKRVSNIKSMLNGAQFYELEGSFSNYFTAIIPKGYGRDALYILTPNVMANLIDNAQNYDIELINNRLYLYMPGGIDTSNPKELQALIDAALNIKQSLEKQTDAYADEKSLKPKEIHYSGKRLVDSVHPAIILTVVALIGAIIIIISGNASMLLMYFFIFFTIAIIFVNPYSK